MTDRCQIPRCRGGVDLIYLDRGVCADHWNELNAGDAPASALRMALGIEAAADPATEDTMARKKTDTTTTRTAAQAAPETPAKPARKRQACGRKTAPQKAEKAARKPKTKPERPPKEELVVFACRVAEPERTAFHRATGPAGASRFARKLMVAFANEDEPGFRALLKEAQEARS